MVHKIVEKVPDEQLKQDLEKYRQMALKLGASDAKIIMTDTVLIDERVQESVFTPRALDITPTLTALPTQRVRSLPEK